MCGIVGYVGKRPCRDLLVAGLEKLEYRGYDSAGISLSRRRPHRLRARRRQPRQPARGGRLAQQRATDGGGGRGRRAAGDDRRRATPAGPPTAGSPRRTPTRTATAPTASTSSSTGSSRTTPSCAASSTAEGHRFSSETDAEIVAHLIERNYDGDLTAAVRASFAELRGHYAFVAMHADAARTAGRRPQGVPAGRRRRRGRDLPRLGDPGLPRRDPRRRSRSRTARSSRSTPEGARSPTPRATRSSATSEEITWDEDTAEKGGYETFMLKEIHEQADAVAETIADRLPGRRWRRPLRARALDDELPARPAADRDRRLRHLLPRRPGRPLRDRGVGAGAGRDGHRLRVPLPQPGGRRRTTW